MAVPITVMPCYQVLASTTWFLNDAEAETGAGLFVTKWKETCHSRRQVRGDVRAVLAYSGASGAVLLAFRTRCRGLVGNDQRPVPKDSLLVRQATGRTGL